MRYSREIIVTSDSSGESWSAACWDPLTGSLLTTYRNSTALGHHCISILNDSYLLAADVTKPRLYLWPLNSQSPVANLRLTMPGKVSALSCSRNGSYIVVAVAEKIFMWQTSSGKLLRILSRHYQTVTCLKSAQNESCFASGGEDGLVFVWSFANVTNYREEAPPKHGFSDHTLPVKDIYLGSFGSSSRLISVSLDRTARIYDLNVGTQLLALFFSVPLTSVCMDIKECNLFVGCTDGMIRQFNLQTPPRGNEFHVPQDTNASIFKGHTGNVTCLSVSIDCTTLLSGGLDGIVNLWDIPSRQISRTIVHKGPITSAIFAPYNANYRASLLEPKILVRPLQRIAEENSKNDIIEIVSPHSNTVNLLNIATYLDDHVENIDSRDRSTEKRADSIFEIEKLKKVNTEIYKHLVDHLISKNSNNIEKNSEITNV